MAVPLQAGAVDGASRLRHVQAVAVAAGRGGRQGGHLGEAPRQLLGGDAAGEQRGWREDGRHVSL